MPLQTSFAASAGVTYFIAVDATSDLFFPFDLEIHLDEPNQAPVLEWSALVPNTRALLKIRHFAGRGGIVQISSDLKTWRNQHVVPAGEDSFSIQQAIEEGKSHQFYRWISQP